MCRLVGGYTSSKEDIMGDEREKETEAPDVEAHNWKKNKANEEPAAEGDDDTPDVEAHRWGHGK